MTWSDALRPYQHPEPALFDTAFMATWAAVDWKPEDDDKAAAAKLHIQLVSRITTQRLGYLDGDEKTALKSVHALFEKARETCAAHPKGRHIEALTWHVLNTHVRPFTAKWHAPSEHGALDALDETDEFRADLNRLQPILQRFDHLLTCIRDGIAGTPVTVTASAVADDRIRVVDELKEDVAFGIRPEFSGFKVRDQIDAINTAERDAIHRRRKHYKAFYPQTSPLDSTSAAALAISGGGIRSATFSLGVLVALAQRDLLPQFDYLSTVSGGGYLGSFLSVFLQTPSADVGLTSNQLPFKREEGEAAALRHIRHHSKYLAVGSAWERLKMVSAQLYGMALNVVAVLWLVLMAVLLEHALRMYVPATSSQLMYGSLVALAIGASVSLVILRFWRGRHADEWVAYPVGLLVLVLCWMGLSGLHRWYATLPPESSWLPRQVGNKALWLAISGAVPVLGPVLAAVFPRLLKRAGVVVAVLTTIAAPLFLLGIYLFLYERSGWLSAPVHVGAVSMTAWVLVAVVGLLVYVFLFDINATSPHRHYRRKLAQAYLIKPKPHSESTFEEDVRVKLSTLGAKGPYHLINCALNVPGSRDIAMQGRLTDFFLFSPAYSGSPSIGYAPTTEWERRDPHLDVGTAMAISGAAAAPQMGLGTIKRFSFWLAVLNVRLGYWARRPGAGTFAFGAPGLWHLVKEMIGSMDETGALINLSDGGHIENLGIYELLRRRCQYIVAIDGEEDAKMTFHGLATLQRLAYIDLGVSIEADLDDLRLTQAGFSRSHFRFCRIRYPKTKRDSEDEFGYLLYVKLSLTGNEGEFIRRYRLDEPAFPHHSTADQFFSEAQFEAYRSLGEHVGNKLFLRAVIGDLADRRPLDLKQWFDALGLNLLEPTTRRRQ